MRRAASRPGVDCKIKFRILLFTACVGPRSGPELIVKLNIESYLHCLCWAASRPGVDGKIKYRILLFTACVGPQSGPGTKFRLFSGGS